MKERPILFSGEMVRAILEGRKTQTRRVMKPQPLADDIIEEQCAVTEPEGWQTAGHSGIWEDHGSGDRVWKCPYGKPGDRLWVRETFLTGWPLNKYDLPDCYDEETETDKPLKVFYRATESKDFTWLHEDGESFHENPPWKPSIHMPRWASRITLEITNVRVERLQDISEEDAKSEGMLFHDGRGIGHSGYRHDINFGFLSVDAQTAFEVLWNRIHGENLRWSSNPWVWVVDFKRVEATK